MKASLIAAVAALASAAGFSFLAVEPAASAPAGAAEALKYEIDNVHSSIIFRVQHLDTGIFYGRFNTVSGSITYDEKSPQSSSIEVSIKADSVDSNNGKRDEHLESPDFLSAKEFPEIAFKSTKVEKKGAELAVTGDLTFHGITKSVTASVPHAKHATDTDPMGLDRVGFEARFEIDPKDFEVRYMTDPKMLGPGIELIVALEATRKP